MFDRSPWGRNHLDRLHIPGGTCSISNEVLEGFILEAARSNIKGVYTALKMQDEDDPTGITDSDLRSRVKDAGLYIRIKNPDVTDENLRLAGAREFLREYDEQMLRRQTESL